MRSKQKQSGGSAAVEPWENFLWPQSATYRWSAGQQLQKVQAEADDNKQSVTNKKEKYTDQRWSVGQVKGVRLLLVSNISC